MDLIKNYTKKRYIVYLIMTIVAMVLPFIRINEKHFFLLSFDKKQLHLLFVQFDMQELYLMPFLLITLFLTIFFVTTLGGRIWCGWACPQTCFRIVYRDLIQTKLLRIRKNIRDKQKVYEGQYFKKAVGIVIWAFLSFLAASNLMWYFIPPEDFFVYLANPSEHGVLIGFLACFTAFLVFDIAFLQEKFCVYICPYARVQSVMFDTDTIQVIYDENRGGQIYDGNVKLWKKPKLQDAQCVGCEACVAVCPTHIDIRKGMQLDCINCLECVDACSRTMSRFNLPTLISWSSKNAIDTKKPVRYFRFRTIAYMVVLCISITALGLMTTKKEHMLLNINRTSELYKIEVENDLVSVRNAYTFLFQNTDSKDHTYYFDVNDTRIKIQKPEEGIFLKAGGKRKVIVILTTNETLVKEERKDTPLKILINAYAKDEKDRVSVDRKTIFVYPKQEIIREKLSKK